MTGHVLLYEMFVTRPMIAGRSLDELIADADGFLPNNVFDLIHGRSDVTVTVAGMGDHFDDYDDQPVVLRWWRDA